MVKMVKMTKAEYDNFNRTRLLRMKFKRPFEEKHVVITRSKTQSIFISKSATIDINILTYTSDDDTMSL